MNGNPRRVNVLIPAKSCLTLLYENDSTNVTQLKWSPDFRVLAVLYENGNLMYMQNRMEL